MAQGKVTKYGRKAIPKVTRPPKREQFLDHDYFYPCQRCDWLWPRRMLMREPVTQLLVCPTDYDQPTVDDMRNRTTLSQFVRAHDRLRDDLEMLP